MPSARRPLVLLAGRSEALGRLRSALLERGYLLLEGRLDDLQELARQYEPAAACAELLADAAIPPESLHSASGAPVPVYLWRTGGQETSRAGGRRVYVIPEDLEELLQAVGRAAGRTEESPRTPDGQEPPPRRDEPSGAFPEVPSLEDPSFLQGLRDVVPRDQFDLTPDIDLDVLDSQNTLPGADVADIEMGDSDLAGLDASAPQDEEGEHWQDGDQSGELAVSASIPARSGSDEPRRPLESLGPVSKPIWMNSTRTADAAGHPPLVTEVTGGPDADPTQDTVVGLKWKQHDQQDQESSREGEASPSGTDLAGLPRGLAWCSAPEPELPASLDQVLPLPILLGAARSGDSWAIRFEAPERTLDVWLERGRLVGVSVAGALPNFLAWLERQFRVTRAQREAAERRSGLDPTRLREVLCEEMGLFARAELRREETAYLSALVYDLASWRTGRAQPLEPEVQPWRLGPIEDWPRLVLESVRRSYLEAECLGTVPPSSTWKWRSEEARSLALDPSQITETERQALLFATQGHSTAEAARRAGVPMGELARLIHGLTLLGFLERAGEPLGQAAGPSPSSEHLPLDAHRDRVLAKLEQVREADYYALLGLSPGAGPREVEEACARLKASFSEPALPRQVAQEFSEELELLHKVLEEARAVLTHPKYAKLYASAFRSDER